MIVLSLFGTRNSNSLNRKEKLAAYRLAIILGNKFSGNYEGVSDNIKKLSYSLYGLAFKRSKRRCVPIEKVMNPFTMLKVKNAATYMAIYVTILELVQMAVDKANKSNLGGLVGDCENFILDVLRSTANEIDDRI